MRRSDNFEISFSCGRKLYRYLSSKLIIIIIIETWGHAGWEMISTGSKENNSECKYLQGEGWTEMDMTLISLYEQAYFRAKWRQLKAMKTMGCIS